VALNSFSFINGTLGSDFGYHRAVSAILEIERKTGFFGVARKMKVYVNEVQVGTVLNGKTLNVPLNEGPSVVYAKMDWWFTPRMQINSQSGSVHRFVIGLDLGKAFLNPIAWLPFVQFEAFTLRVNDPLLPSF